MLPGVLCENLCSLNPKDDRYAFSVVWKMTPEGEILDEWMSKTIIRSRVKLAYEDAQLVLEDFDAGLENLKLKEPEDDPIAIANDIVALNKLATVLRKKRMKNENASLNLGRVQLYFDLDDDFNPISYHPHKQKEANRLVEDFMLLANKRVAEFILQNRPSLAVLRMHPEPDEEQLDKFVTYCEEIGVSVEVDSIDSLLDCIAHIPESYPHIPYIQEVLVLIQY